MNFSGPREDRSAIGGSSDGAIALAAVGWWRTDRAFSGDRVDDVMTAAAV